jgi:hypothetical protein
MALTIGTRLGPYEVLGPLGAGGMGEVYRARDTRLGREVAIKTVNAASTERFEREARAISALNHPHICTLYDVGSHEGSGYLVMELVEGQPLRGPMAWADAVAVDLRTLVRPPPQALRRAAGARGSEDPRSDEQPRHAPRRRWLWALGGALAIAAMALGGVWQWQRSRVHPRLPSKVQEANEDFQRAMLFLSAQQDLPRARQLLQKALALDPAFAHARAMYGFTHVLLIDSGMSNDTSWLYKAEAELQRALKDDPNSARAHASLAMVYLYQVGDTAKAIDWLDRAVRLGDERAAWFERNPLLASIRTDTRFRQIVDGIRSRREQRSGK